MPPVSSRSQNRGLGAGPQVVIGHATRTSEEIPASAEVHATIDARGARETRDAREADVDHVATPSGHLRGAASRNLELLAEPSLMLVPEERLMLVREGEEDDRDEEAEAAANHVPPFPSSSELPAAEPSSPELLAAPLAEAAWSSPDLEPREAEAEAERDLPSVAESEPEPTFELVESQPAGAVMHMTALATPDEMSIPPVGDLAVEPIADRFFSEGEVLSTRVLDVEDEGWDPAVDNGQRKSLPHVVERRARFSKYVRWAVGGAAVLCVAALATAILPSRGAATASALHEAPPVAKAAAALEAPAPAAQPAAPPATAPGAPEANVDAPKVDVPKAEGAPEAPSTAAKPEGEVAAAAAATTAPTTAPASEAAAAPAPGAPAPGDKTALQEKNDARRSLERGKLAESIAAGERSVALDPTDGEAWLLLGAAYQEKGKIADARRCYTACLKEGKRGPLGECGAMLR